MRGVRSMEEQLCRLQPEEKSGSGSAGKLPAVTTSVSSMHLVIPPYGNFFFSFSRLMGPLYGRRHARFPHLLQPDFLGCNSESVAGGLKSHLMLSTYKFHTIV